MTYLQFHLVFLLPAIVIASIVSFRRRTMSPRRLAGMGILVVVALAYTTPWDNYLVYRSIWSYGPERVLATIGYVPIEEYAFFVLQTILTCLVYSLVVRNTTIIAPMERNLSLRLVGIVVFGAVTALGLALLYVESTLYLGLITAWAAPVLALQWGFGAELFLKYRRIWFVSIVPLSLYLWFADAIAIRLEIWEIASVTTTGLNIFGLPMEEALFFFVTTLFVAQGMLLIDAWRRKADDSA